MPKKLFFAPTLNTPRKKKKKTKNVWSYAKCTHRNPNGKINKSHKSISNGTIFHIYKSTPRGVFPLFVSIVNYRGGDCNFFMENKGGLCI